MKPRVVRAAALVFTAWTAPAWAQDAVSFEWRGAGGCPTEPELRLWLARGLEGAPVSAPRRVVATAVHEPDGRWTLVLHTHAGAAHYDDVFHADDCETLARLAVQEVVFDHATSPAAEPRTAPTPPTPPSRRWSRWSFDVGAGAGAAVLSGTPAYAESRQVVDPMGRVVRVDCGGYVCVGTIDPGVAFTYYLSVGARFAVTRRVAVGVGLRYQFDAADWTIDSAMGPPKSNPMANLLVMARGYYALTDFGFAREEGGLVALFAGGGIGQIEPSPRLPASVSGPAAHVVTGYANAHTGVRAEYRTRIGVLVGGEVTAQLMFPEFLFDVDATLLVGMRL